MRWKRTARWSWLVLPFLVLALWPGVSAAQVGVRPDANAILYEVTENMKMKGNMRSEYGKGVARVATAALMGSVDADTPLCPATLAEALRVTSCSITAIASDNISLGTGKGPVEGTFAVVIQDNNSVDGPEFVILRGDLQGTIDLSPAVLHGIPLGFIKASWRARGVEDLPLPAPLKAVIAGIRARGTLDGTFRLPFGTMDNAFYLCDPVAEDCFPMERVGPVAPVEPNERSLAVPTVRLEVNFAGR